ncbi:MAG: hydroxymethylpyrimidine/phosphomethylpyrimidine kinase [Zoogloeaceae bacterium]|jgi:hydroxymethylpyrimidine/phosphomethylpyrimidine kinase|nr:hydroxymethylpyrimidine/phosphomethylpyrimidine kinase [Zoogloeaceae bacterium]
MQDAVFPPAILVFAASDPTGGAGLQADILTLAALGVHPLSAVTALTVQDTTGVARVASVPADLVRQQAETLLRDIAVTAFKVGVLGSVENAACVAEIADRHPGIPLILDPVLASGRGDVFADAPIRAVLREKLLPRATLVTPNLLEAYRLLEEEPPTGILDSSAPAAMAGVAHRLIALGARYVLITGTHAPADDVINRLYGPDGPINENRWPRLPESYHGSGCTLASAIAACLARALARGLPHARALSEAVRQAEEYTWRALARGFQLGSGQWLPNRFPGMD